MLGEGGRVGGGGSMLGEGGREGGREGGVERGRGDYIYTCIILRLSIANEACLRVRLTL